MSSFERGGGGGDRRYLSVAASDSGTAQLMVAMQPGVDLSTVEVQEVVVVTDRDRRFRSPSVVARRNRRSCCYEEDDDEEEDNADMHTRGEDEIIECDYETSEAVAAEIEVVDGRIGGLEGLLGTKARRGRLKRRRGRFAKKSPPSKAIRTTTTKTMNRKRIVESSPDFGESDSDAVDEAGYGRSLLKRRRRNFAHRLQWRDADMQDAMLAVREKNATIRGAAKQFDVPYSTLKDRVRNRVKHGTKPGMKTALSPEDEEELVRCIQQMVSAGFHMQGIDIREHAHDFRNRNKHCSANSKHRSAVPGHNWLAGFLKRHPSIELSRSVNRPALLSVSKQKHMLRRFFDVTSAAYQKLSRPLQAAQLYTMSELKLSSFPHTSLFLTTSANGTILPPYVLFSGSRILMPRLQQHFPSATFSVYLNPGQRKDVLLSWFRDHFLPHVQQNGTGRPVVLFIAQLACNISVHFVSLANDRRVSLVCMPTGILHLVQPLDDIVLRKIDELITKCGQRYLEDRKTPSVDQIGMAEILQKVWQRGLLPSREVALNFKENGLFPFNMRAVTHERIATSTPLVDVEKDGEVSSDDETDGLALLSELSSLDQNVGETKNVNFGQKRVRNGTAEISPYKRHKLSPENSSYDADNFEQKISIETKYSVVTPQFSEEPMKHMLTDETKAGACSRMRPVRHASHRPHRNAHQEVQTSRQLEGPIKGMFDETSNSISTHGISSRLRNSAGNNTSKTCKNVSSNSISRSTDDSTSNFVTLTPVYRILEISPNIKQEYISYVEDPHEEFVPQEIVEGQTVVQDCMTYEMPLNAFCKEEVIEEVIDLPQFILSADDDVNPEGIKVENVDEEFFNNNELSYDLQTEEVSNVTGNGCLVGPVVKAFNIIPDSGSKSNLDDADETTTYIEVNGCSYPVVQTLSIQEFRKTFGIVSQAAGLLLGNGSEDIKDEN